MPVGSGDVTLVQESIDVPQAIGRRVMTAIISLEWGNVSNAIPQCDSPFLELTPKSIPHRRNVHVPNRFPIRIDMIAVSTPHPHVDRNHGGQSPDSEPRRGRREGPYQSCRRDRRGATPAIALLPSIIDHISGSYMVREIPMVSRPMWTLSSWPSDPLAIVRD